MNLFQTTKSKMTRFQQKRKNHDKIKTTKSAKAAEMSDKRRNGNSHGESESLGRDEASYRLKLAIFLLCWVEKPCECFFYLPFFALNRLS